MAIRIECKGADVLPLDAIEEFQGNLKKRSKKDIDLIITSIDKYGFSFPFFIWNGTGHNLCLDGHGRIQALAEMRRRGEDLPLFPVVYVEARDEAEAKNKLLRLNSQYGQMTVESVLEFAGDVKIEFDELILSDGSELKLKQETEDEEDEEDKTREKFNDERDEEPIEKLLERYENIYISFSGGKDSIATALKIKEMGFAEKSTLTMVHVPIFCFENEVRYSEYCAEKLGMKIKILQTAETEEDIINKLKKRGYPGRLLNWCNSDYKVKPLNDFYKENANTNYIMAIGNRAEESERRAAMLDRGKWNGRDFIFPIFNMSQNEVVELINKAGIAAHPVYKYFSRFSCSICYQQTKGKWRVLKKEYPEEWGKAIKLFGEAIKAESFRGSEYCAQLYGNMVLDPKDEEREYGLQFDNYWNDQNA